MYKKSIIFIVSIALAIIVFITLLFKIQKSPSELLIEQMKNSTSPVESILLQVKDPENNYNTLVFYLTSQNTLGCGYYKKTNLGYKYITTISELNAFEIEREDKNHIVSILTKDPLKYMALGILNSTSDINSISFGNNYATIIQRNGYRFWYMHLDNALPNSESIEFN